MLDDRLWDDEGQQWHRVRGEGADVHGRERTSTERIRTATYAGGRQSPRPCRLPIPAERQSVLRAAAAYGWSKKFSSTCFSTKFSSVTTPQSYSIMGDASSGPSMRTSRALTRSA